MAPEQGLEPRVYKMYYNRKTLGSSPSTGTIYHFSGVNTLIQAMKRWLTWPKRVQRAA